MHGLKKQQVSSKCRMFMFFIATALEECWTIGPLLYRQESQVILPACTLVGQEAHYILLESFFSMHHSILQPKASQLKHIWQKTNIFIVAHIRLGYIATVQDNEPWLITASMARVQYLAFLLYYYSSIGDVHCQHTNFRWFSYICHMLHHFNLITF